MGLMKTREMSHVDVRTVDIKTLKNIDQIEIDTTLPKRERLQSFIEKTENPFCFVCNGMVVKTSYSDTNESLENKLVQLCRFISMDS